MLERLRKTYPDLQSGRFVSLASFESAKEAELFRIVGLDGDEGGRPQPTINLLRSREETGVGSLLARLGDPLDSLWLDGARSRALSLPRNWERFALLLMSAYAPPGGLTLDFSIRSGQTEPLVWSRTLRLEPGWNLLRIDLADVAESIDLRDVRGMSWRAVDASAGPVDVLLDDLVLADNSETVLAGPGEGVGFEVTRRGRRLIVAVAGRFELAFRDGLIVSWKAGDAENLTVSSGLGPWPVPLDSDWYASEQTPPPYDDPSLFAEWGQTVAAAQRIVFAAHDRVVIEGLWRFVESARPDPQAREKERLASHTWRYTLYPDGRVYVRVTSDGGVLGWPRPQAGYAIALAGRRGFARPAERSGLEPMLLLARDGRERSDLLWVPHVAEAARRAREMASADGRRIAVIAGSIPAGEVVETAHLLQFWPTDLDDLPEAQMFARDYRVPATTRVARGRVVSDAEGDLNHDGFNESVGCYELAADDGALRLAFDGGGELHYAPRLRIAGTSGKRCWAYVDGRTVAGGGRDEADNFVLELAGVVRGEVSIELHCGE